MFSSWSGTVTEFQILASSYVSMLFLPPSTFKEHPTPMFYHFIHWFLPEQIHEECWQRVPGEHEYRGPVEVHAEQTCVA